MAADAGKNIKYSVATLALCEHFMFFPADSGVK